MILRQFKVNSFWRLVLCGISVGVGATSISNTGSASDAGSTYSATLSKSIQVLGFANSSAQDGGKDFSVTFSAADILTLSAYRTLGGDYATDLINASTTVWLPVAQTQVCLRSNIPRVTTTTSGLLQAAATIGAMTDQTNQTNTLKTAVFIKGNGNMSTDSNQRIFFCNGTCASTNKFVTTNIVDSDNGATLGTLGTYADHIVETVVWPWPGSVSDDSPYTNYAKIDSNNASAQNFNHTSTQTDSNYYNVASTQPTSDTTGFALGKTVFVDDTCGDENDDAVDVIVFVSLEDVISNPAAIYEGTVNLDFSISSSSS